MPVIQGSPRHALSQTDRRGLPVASTAPLASQPGGTGARCPPDRCSRSPRACLPVQAEVGVAGGFGNVHLGQIGRASCRERVSISVVAGTLKKKRKTKRGARAVLRASEYVGGGPTPGGDT